MSHNITVEGGTSVRLKTAGKYCDRDIVVTSIGGTGGEGKPEQEKTVDITENGTTEVTSDEGKYLSKVTIDVNVPSDGGGELPNGYKKCDYIQFSGVQWIDTGIIGTQDTQICTSFTWENSTQRQLFGCADSNNKKAITAYMNGAWRFGNKYMTKSIASKNPKVPYGAFVNKTTIGVSNSVTSISDVNDFETSGTLLLGGARDSDGSEPSVGITGKVFYFYLWSGEEQVRKLVPVVSTEGQYRFFDMISKTFFDSITNTPLDGGNF